MASVFGIDDMNIFGDSRVTIKWAQGEYNLKVLSLIQWSNMIKSTILHFRNISLEHIYRQHNLLVEKISKQALSSEEGFLIWEEFLNSQIVDLGSLRFFFSRFF